MKNRFWLLAVCLSALSGCGSSRPIGGAPGTEDAAIRLEESEREYNDCLHRLAPGQPTCDGLKALYKKDKAEFEADANYQ